MTWLGQQFYINKIYSDYNRVNFGYHNLIECSAHLKALAENIQIWDGEILLISKNMSLN